ncbi:MAG TPA: T9SS type A sorting domain-containing protein [Bacteroidia bacterium]|nr:T9SS type A sorting domain-containing protein [Bacteroidia bacterium]
MKKHLPFLLLFTPAFSGAQNLLLNPGFEDSLQCPSGSGAFVNYVAVWTKPSYGSADYFYAGCPIAPNDEPPHGGNAYGGIIVYDPANIREYMTGHLSAPLVAGTTYAVSFYVCLHSSSMEAINEIGAYCTATNISYANANPIILTPQIQGSTPYTSQNGWQLVQGTFVATGGEQYLIIGSFVPYSMMTFTTVQTTGWGDVYYYVDDVCLAVETQSCEGPTGIAPTANTRFVSVFPNPSASNTTLKFTNADSEVFSLSVFNSCGEMVFYKPALNTAEVEIQRDGLAGGLYYYLLQSGHGSYSGKFVWE